MMGGCRLPLASLCALALSGAHAETSTAAAGNPSASLSAVARLAFVLNVGKFLYFRVGAAAYPTPSSSVSLVAFNVAPSIPAVPTVPAGTGNSVGVSWSGGAPGLAVTAAGNVLPVEVRSNAGQISLRTTVTGPLASGANSIPLSQIGLNSDTALLPAPPIPNGGTGAAATVTGTAYGDRVTQRSANWTFSYAPVGIPPAGTYSGQISFTAASP